MTQSSSHAHTTHVHALARSNTFAAIEFSLSHDIRSAVPSPSTLAHHLTSTLAPSTSIYRAQGRDRRLTASCAQFCAVRSAVSVFCVGNTGIAIPTFHRPRPFEYWCCTGTKSRFHECSSYVTCYCPGHLPCFGLGLFFDTVFCARFACDIGWCF